jgi:hypothetical protein
MAGIRIHHTSLKDCTLIVHHPGRQGQGQGQGNPNRKPKDYHVHLDSEGNTIVSETVWQRIQQATRGAKAEHSFVVLNEVPDPPDLVVGNPNAGQHVERTFRMDQDGEVRDSDLQAIAQQFAPKGVKPRITSPGGQ